MRGLYAIVDVDTLDDRNIPCVEFAAAVLEARPAALQLRAKNLPSREALALLRQLAPMCHRAGVPLVANDRPDLAIFAGCDLAHVGQRDMPIERVRRLAPGLGVGVSTHTIDELEEALGARPAYVAFGPVFQTTTKKQPEPVVGVTALQAAHERAQAAKVPLVAIGGITLERAPELVGLVECVAVIAALVPAAYGPLPMRRPRGDALREVADRARAFQELFGPPLSRGLAR